MSSSEPTPSPKDYEIAQPQSYDVLSFDPKEKPQAKEAKARVGMELDVHAQPSVEGRYPAEEWDDERVSGPSEAKTELQVGKLAPDEKTEGRVKHAVWIVHGMGQQIPFETLDSLTKGLQKVALPPGGASLPRFRTVKIGDQVVQRVELDVAGLSGKRYDLHLYECYWAPKTEGVAKLRDVVAFLMDGGMRGLLNSHTVFGRAMFGGVYPFPVNPRAPVEILLTLAALAALAVVNLVILAAGSALYGLPGGKSLINPAFWPSVTSIASCMCAVVLAFGNILFLADLSKPGSSAPRRLKLIHYLTWGSLWITLGAILATGGFLAAIVMKIAVRLPPEQQSTALQGFSTLMILGCGLLAALALTRRGQLRSLGSRLAGDSWLTMLFWSGGLLYAITIAGQLSLLVGDQQILQYAAYLELLTKPHWVWPFLIAVSWLVRSLLVDYVGDVAIYVTPNKLDRFERVRNDIKSTARTTASAVYLAQEPGGKHFLYDKIAVVGHSLGSVIAYDTLNRLMLDDWLSGNQLHIAFRTGALITFGSPLDKTAFFFTIQGTDSFRIRERLAATVQPLIQSYKKFRKFNWINIYSPNDIISGILDFYDKPKENRVAGENAVDNVEDKNAVVPLVAHVDYWKNDLIWKRLYGEIAP